MRRSHRKSRHGCRVCKQRHIKCDESKPSCLNCLAVERKCSFPDTAPTQLSSPSPSPSALNPEPAPQTAALGEDYTISHLELFHHFEHTVALDIRPSKPGSNHIMQRTIQESFAFPFLMDELLALSAAHKSSLDPAQRESYLAEATRLQTRGLSRFNAAQAELSDHNCVAIFLYSAILGQHVLFDTFSLQSDFEAVMSKLVQCLSLHSGIRTIATSSLPKIHRELLSGDTSRLALEPLKPVGPDDECAPILGLLEESELSDEEKGDCLHATKALQCMFERRRLGIFSGALATQEWAVRVPTGYVGLLNQRRPEAMVILAYYAVLLHHDRERWAIGDTGAYLVRSITGYLGEGWARWLEWPNRVMEEYSASRPASGAGGSPSLPDTPCPRA